MKRGTTPTLPVRLKLKITDIESIEFLFKQIKAESAPEILKKVYPGDDVEFNEDTGLFGIAFSEADTRLFAEDEPFYMDTRIVLVNGKIPETPIVTLRMHPTLFEAVDEESEDDGSEQETSPAG